MSTCADGFNYAFARRGPVLEDSRFSFMGDDSVNLHGPVLICSPHGVVENCTFRRLKRLGLKLDPGHVFWREAGWVENVTVRGNVFEDVGICPDTWSREQYELGAIMVGERREPDAEGLAYPAANQDITIENNTIRGCSVAGIYVRCARDVAIRGNRLSHTNYAAAPEAGAARGLSLEGAIDVRGVPGVTLQDNEITALGEPLP